MPGNGPKYFLYVNINCTRIRDLQCCLHKPKLYRYHRIHNLFGKKTLIAQVLNFVIHYFTRTKHTKVHSPNQPLPFQSNPSPPPKKKNIVNVSERFFNNISLHASHDNNLWRDEGGGGSANTHLP